MPFGLKSLYGADIVNTTFPFDDYLMESQAPRRRSRARRKKSKRASVYTARRNVRRRKSRKSKAHSSGRKGKKRSYPHHLKKYMFKKGHR